MQPLEMRGHDKSTADRVYGRMDCFQGRLCTISTLVSEHVASSSSEHGNAINRVKRHRSSTRRLMILVAIVAMFLWSGKVWQQWVYRTKMAKFHRQYEELNSGAWPADMNPDEVSLSMAVMRPRKDLVAYHSRMRRKWERAAYCPWNSVEPDPPRP